MRISHIWVSLILSLYSFHSGYAISTSAQSGAPEQNTCTEPPVPQEAYCGLFGTRAGTPGGITHYYYACFVRNSDGTWQISLYGRIANSDATAASEVLENFIENGTWNNLDGQIERFTEAEDINAALAAADEGANDGPGYLTRCLYTAAVPFTGGYSKPCYRSAERCRARVRKLKARTVTAE